MPPSDELQITSAPPQRVAESLRLVFVRLGDDDRRQQVQTHLPLGGDAPLEGLLEARRSGRLVGAVFSQIQSGKTAVVWMPGLVAGEPQATADELLTAACRLLAGRELTMAHVMLQSVTKEDDVLLCGAGFEPLTKLLYMFSTENEFPAARPTGPLEFEPYCEATRTRLAHVVGATYRQTRDCPQLNGIRRIEDVLAGYRNTGVFEPSRWLIVRHQGRDVGCLIVAEHPEHGCCELVYMGLVVSARGNGWGRHITQHAQWLTRHAGQERLVLAVDAANSPAINMYTDVGFRTWDRRSVYVKLF